MRKLALTRRGIEVFLLVISVLVAYWIFCALAYGQKNLIPPELPSVTDLHCAVEPTQEGWQAKAIVSYVNPAHHHDGTPWIVQIAEFKSKNRKKARASAEKSCNDWLDAVAKVRAEIQPVDVKQIKKEKNQ